MKSDEFKEIFLAEAQESQEELNKLFTDLEKNHSNKKAIEAIFRITHTLKANAAGMGFENIASVAHTMEDVFSEIKNNKVSINKSLFDDLFKANDILGAMINNIKTPGKEVKYRGIKAKLEVFLRELRKQESEPEAPAVSVNEVQTPITPMQEAKPKSVEPQKQEIFKSNNEGGLSIPVVGNISVGNHEMVAEFSGPEVALMEEEKPDEQESKITFSDNIHIPVRKLDNLLNLVGELMIEKDRVVALNSENARGMANEFARLQRITSELQYSVMDVRLVQVGVLFNKFHRIVRDVANIENKQVNLILEGTENEIDRNILQIISDSLIHLVRNAVSHGIETEKDRVAAKKPSKGTVRLSARTEREEVVIDVIDDGKGINPQVIKKKALEKKLISEEHAKIMTDDDFIQLIFEPGFSSAEKITSVSGRGVGMDVVKRSIDSIGGKIYVKSEAGAGTTISLVLPSSMAVKGALLFELGTGEFAIPLSYTDAVISLNKKDIHKVGSGLMARHLDTNISVVFLNDLFNLMNATELSKEGILHRSFDKLKDTDKIYIVVVSYNNRVIGFVVDKLLQQKEIVEKPLGSLLEGMMFISGATILGNGNICLVLDAPSIMNFLFKSKISK